MPIGTDSEPGTAAGQPMGPTDARANDEPSSAVVARSDPPQPEQPNAQLLALAAFKTFLETTRVVGGDINRHAATYMGAFGAALILIGLGMQVDFSGVEFTLTSSEFIALVVAGLIMICLGAGLIAFRLRAVERTEVAYGEQAKEILARDPLIPGSTLRDKVGDASVTDTTTGRPTPSD